MIRQLSLMAGLFLTFCAASQPSRVAKAEVGWSAHPIKVDFQQSEPIIIAYELINRSKSELWVPKSIDPFVSVRLRVYDPDGRPMNWNGARFTFKYDQSNLVNLLPGQTKSGTFVVPRACPDEKVIEKGGFCFQKRGAYRGAATFQMGLNAFYHRDEIHGQIAEGPYSSDGFTFALR